MGKYQQSIMGNNSMQQQLSIDGTSPLYLTLVQLKTLLDSYDSASGNIKLLYRQKFTQLANNSVQIVN